MWKQSDGIREALTPNDMRAELFRQAQFNPTVCDCYMVARIQGNNGEDTMTILAYNLLIANRRLLEAAIEQANLRTVQPIFIHEDSGVPE